MNARTISFEIDSIHSSRLVAALMAHTALQLLLLVQVRWHTGVELGTAYIHGDPNPNEGSLGVQNLQAVVTPPPRLGEAGDPARGAGEVQRTESGSPIVTAADIYAESRFRASSLGSLHTKSSL